MAQEAKPSQEPLVLKLPHPYLTTYTVSNVAPTGQPTSYQIQLIPSTTTGKEISPPAVLHDESISFTDIGTLGGAIQGGCAL